MRVLCCLLGILSAAMAIAAPGPKIQKRNREFNNLTADAETSVFNNSARVLFGQSIGLTANGAPPGPLLCPDGNCVDVSHLREIQTLVRREWRDMSTHPFANQLIPRAPAVEKTESAALSQRTADPATARATAMPRLCAAAGARTASSPAV